MLISVQFNPTVIENVYFADKGNKVIDMNVVKIPACIYCLS